MFKDPTNTIPITTASLPLLAMCPPDEIYAFPLPPETYQRYVLDTVGTKTILSKGVTGFHFPDTEKENNKNNITNKSDPFSEWKALANTLSVSFNRSITTFIKT